MGKYFSRNFVFLQEGIPRGGVTFFKEFRISASGIPRGGVAFFKDFHISARGIPRGGVRLFTIMLRASAQASCYGSRIRRERLFPQRLFALRSPMSSA